ncbi:hypothetical protein FRC11_013912 [Ceratobasidium sp. 423]|nr:hypothetical protein FRC11_013912 [Ceratobasidium sp. 423]
MGTHSHIASFVGIAPVNLFDAKYFAKGPVSDYCVQGNLKTYLGKSDPDVIKHQLRFRLLLDVIRGVTHVHAQSIVHGDLKALNVLVDGDEGKQVARICDFGSSSINCVCYTGPREQEGTVLWDSPELWVPQEDSDETPSRTRQSDVWAFGCLALEVQMGLMPWDPLDERKPWPMKRRQLEAGMGPPATISDPKLDLDAHPIKRHVWNLMDLCWNADPQQRPTAADLLNRMLGISTAAM